MFWIGPEHFQGSIQHDVLYRLYRLLCLRNWLPSWTRRYPHELGEQLMLGILKDLRFDVSGLAVVMAALSVGILAGWSVVPVLWNEQ
jgi:hypothetical protein